MIWLRPELWQGGAAQIFAAVQGLEPFHGIFILHQARVARTSELSSIAATLLFTYAPLFLALLRLSAILVAWFEALEGVARASGVGPIHFHLSIDPSQGG
jgi:hypothetical protein